MRKYITIALLAFGLMAVSCHEPQYIPTEANRQSLTSLTAIFTFGPYINQEMGTLTITDDEQDYFVIPVPYYYPATSDNESEIYLKKARIQATLDVNCFIEPALTILDLTKENWCTLKKADGTQKQICITGGRVKSSECLIQSFVLDDPAIVGVVDKTAKSISLVSAADLSACTATVAVSAHATISPDPAEPHNYNEPVTFTVTADDGTTKSEWTVTKGIPEKIDAGFNVTSVEQLFNFDPVSRLGMPAYDATVNPTLGLCGSNLVISLGNGTDPVYVNNLTGDKLGTLSGMPEAIAAITNDEAGHLLLCNHAEAKGTFNVYTTSDVTAAPTLFYSMENTQSLPMGYELKVIGDITGKALIVVTNEGVAGVTTSSVLTLIKVEDGAAVSNEVVDLSASGLGWGASPVNGTSVVATSTDPSTGYIVAYYDANIVNWVRNGAVAYAGTAIGGGSSWGIDVNNLDSKTFNNVTYGAVFAVSHFPHWGMGPELFLYDLSEGSAIANDSYVLSNTSLDWYQKGAAGVAAGDVVLAPSTDGYYLYIYYYDHNSQSIGGYSADCIKR